MSSNYRANSIDTFFIAGTFGLLLFLFYPTLHEIAFICWTDDDYSHGLLLPFIAAYMIKENWRGILKKVEEARARNEVRENRLAAALLLLFAGVLLYFIGQASGISYTCWIAFFPTLLAVLHLLFGRTAAFSLAPSVLLLFMAKPLPDSVVVRIFWPLQVLAAKVSAFTLEMLRVPVYLSGNVIEIPSMKLLVEEACSGMRSVMALVTLALIVLYFVDLSWLSSILLVLLSLAVAILMNVFRVALTGIIAHFLDPKLAQGFFHTFSGLIVFIVGLPILYVLGRALMKWDHQARRGDLHA